MSHWSEATEARARQIISRYPEKRSAVMPLLYLAMAEEGYLTDAGMEEVAVWCGITPAQVRSVASFYTMYNLKPAGKVQVQVCTTTPCWLRGSDQVVEACEKAL
ncbi:MAG TPA: NAD(P)H-dependent oxidoreductase subunit E, partial [Acidimicrobiia bacterium]